jgi:hypothetical protein
MENDGTIVLVPLTKKEYRDARGGHIVQKRCIINDNDCCIIISNRFIGQEEITYFLDRGFDVFPIDISEISWWDINRKMKFNIVAQYSNGISLCIISQNMYHQLQKEREEDESLEKG